MGNLLDCLSSKDKARLIPVVADTSKEVRATSVLLATLSCVEPLAKSLLGSVGQRLGSRSKLDCFTEVVFKKCPSDSKIRPDGLLIVTVGKRTWSALVEAKIGNALLDENQIGKYCSLAKLNKVNAVITLSNQFAALPTHYPLKLKKSATRGVELYHWSWMYTLTQAKLLLDDEDFDSSEQSYILNEMVRFFDHKSAGISTFDRMNPEWKDLITKVQSGGRLGKTSPEVENSVAAWHQEQRDLCLLMSRKLKCHVTQKLSRAHNNDPVRRLKDDCESLVKTQKIFCSLEVPDTAALIEVCADLRRRTFSCSMTLEAPKDKQRYQSRVNWLLRQLSEADPEDTFIRAKLPNRPHAPLAKLSDLKEDLNALRPENISLLPLSFDIIMIKDLAGKFSGSRTFIESLETFVPHFYEQVGQHLRAWIPPPPKIGETQPSTEQQE